MYMDGVWDAVCKHDRQCKGIKKYWETFCTGIDVKCTGLWETVMEWAEGRVQAKGMWELIAAPHKWWVEESPPNILQL
jgi:hypothetical protein